MRTWDAGAWELLSGTGTMVIASNNFISHVVDAPMAEAYALKEGLMLAQHAGCNRVIIQSDCMEVAEIMGDGGFTANSVASIHNECITIWLGFQKISIEYCRRETNQVVYESAKQAMISKIFIILSSTAWLRKKNHWYIMMVQNRLYKL